MNTTVTLPQELVKLKIKVTQLGEAEKDLEEQSKRAQRERDLAFIKAEALTPPFPGITLFGAIYQALHSKNYTPKLNIPENMHAALEDLSRKRRNLDAIDNKLWKVNTDLSNALHALREESLKFVMGLSL